MRVHDIQRHLHGVKQEAVLSRHVEHVQMDVGILMSREADIPDLARSLPVDERTVGAFPVEDAMWIVIPQDLVMLHEIDAIGLQTLERLVELPRRFCIGSPVDLGHEKDLLSVAVPERLSHAGLALAVVVVPAVVQEVDATIDRRSNDPETELLVDPVQSEMPAPKADRGDSFPGPTQRAIRDCGLHNTAPVLACSLRSPR